MLQEWCNNAEVLLSDLSVVKDDLHDDLITSELHAHDTHGVHRHSDVLHNTLVCLH